MIRAFTSSHRFEKAVGTDHTSGTHPDGTAWETRKAVYEPVIADLELTIDVDALMRHLGHKALHSKARRSTAFHGLVKVKVLAERKA